MLAGRAGAAVLALAGALWLRTAESAAVLAGRVPAPPVRLVVQAGHVNSVTSVAFAPSADLVASADRGGGVALWDVRGGTQVASWSTGARPVVAFRPDGKVIACAGRGGDVSFWSSSSGARLSCLATGLGDVEALGFGRNGALVGAAGSTGGLQLWDVGTGARLRMEPASHRVVNTSFGFSELVVEVFREEVCVTDFRRGRVLCSVPAEGALSAAVSADGKLVATTGPDGTYLWDATCAGEPRRLGDASEGGSCVVFSPRGNLVAVCEGLRVCLWEVATGLRGNVLEDGVVETTSIAFDGTGSRLVGGGADGVVRVWSSRTGDVIQRLAGRVSGIDGFATWGRGGLLGCVAVEPPRARGADPYNSGSSGGAVRLWDLRRGCASVLSTLTSDVGCLAVSPDGTMMATGHDSGQVCLWMTAARRRVARLDASGVAEFAGVSPIRLVSLAFARDGNSLASASTDGRIRIWDVRARRAVRVLASARLIVAFGRSASQLVAAGGDGINVWCLDDGRQLPVEPAGAPGRPAAVLISMGLSASGDLVACGGEDGAVVLWDLATGKLRRRMMAGRAPVWSVAFSPDGRLLAAAGEDGIVRLWDTVSWSQLQPVRVAPTFWRGSIGFCGGSHVLLSAAWNDWAVRAWRVDAGQRQQLCLLCSLVDGGWAVVGAGERYDSSGAGSASALVAVVRSGSIPVGAAHRPGYSPGLLARALRSFLGSAPRRPSSGRRRPGRGASRPV
jgi:WD40 repeat protein